MPQKSTLRLLQPTHAFLSPPQKCAVQLHPKITPKTMSFAQKFVKFTSFALSSIGWYMCEKVKSIEYESQERLSTTLENGQKSELLSEKVKKFRLEFRQSGTSE